MSDTTADQLKTFSELLYEPDDIVELRFIADKCKIKNDWFKANKLPGLADELLQQNGYGYNLYAGVNPRRSERLSGDANVTCARSLFADFDFKEVPDGACLWSIIQGTIEKSGLPSPTLVINSGHGIHVYWKLAQPLNDMARWRKLQEGLIAVLGSDPVIKNPERIMRLPGFLNKKRKPYVPCRIIEADKARIYAVDEIESILQIPQEPKPGNLTQFFKDTKIHTRSDQERALDCLESLKPARADDYGDWLKVGMALHYSGLDCSVWDKWSAQSTKYKPGECQRKWDSFGKGGGGTVSLGTLIHMANEDNSGFKKIRAVNLVKASTADAIEESVSNTYKSIIDGTRQSISWPWPQLGKLSKSLINGSITVLCGSPGASKSFMLLQACLHWFQKGVPFALLALEENRVFHLMRLLAQITGKPELSSSGMDWIKSNPEEVKQILDENSKLLGAFGQHLWERMSTTMTLIEAGNWIEERAKEGRRIIAVDPITIVESDKPWIDDKLFIGRVGKIATDYNCSVIVISHPVKAFSNPDMNQLAGSTAYARFVQNILWLECENDEKESIVIGPDRNITSLKHNRTLHILKARHGKGSGKRIAMEFNDSLCLKEVGIIVSKQQDDVHQTNLNFRAEKGAEKAQSMKEAALANERAARERKAAVEASERGKTERAKIKAEAKTMLPLKNKLKDKKSK